jgi:hypothetical protein
MDELETLNFKLVEIQQKIDKLNNSDPYLDQVKEHFHLGMVGGSGNRKNLNKLNLRRERSVNKSIEQAKIYTKLIEEKDFLLKRIEFIVSGKKVRQDNLKEIMKNQVLSAQVGDLVIDSAYGEVKVARVNKKTLTIETKSGYREARPFNLIIGVKQKVL